MSPEKQDPTLAAAARLEQSMSSLGREMKSLREYGQRTRGITWALAISLVFDFALSIALGIVAWQASSASERATEATSAAAQNRQNAKVTCQAGNDARAAQIRLWTYVLDLSERPNATPDQQKRIENFRTYIQVVFARRNCDDPTQPTVQPPTPSPTR